MKPWETPWDLDQRLKCMIYEANMNLTNGQHHQFFMASILPHLRVALSQQKIGTQDEALEIMMRLYETPIQDDNLGVQQIHTQLQKFFLEMQSLKKHKTAQSQARKEVWCLKCKCQGHDKDHCPIFVNYVVARGRMPLRLEAMAGPSTRLALWCAIWKVAGKHATNHCHLLQKFVQTPQQLFYNLYQSVGHDKCNCCQHLNLPQSEGTQNSW